MAELFKITKMCLTRIVVLFRFLLLALYNFCITNKNENINQTFSGNEAIQESSCPAHEQLEVMCPALVIVSDCSSQTYDEHRYLNESVTVENISVTLI